MIYSTGYVPKSILENFPESQQISPLCLPIDLPLELEYILNYPLIAFTEKFFFCFHNGDWLVSTFSSFRPSLDAKPNNNIELSS